MISVAYLQRIPCPGRIEEQAHSLLHRRAKKERSRTRTQKRTSPILVPPLSGRCASSNDATPLQHLKRERTFCPSQCSLAASAPATPSQADLSKRHEHPYLKYILYQWKLAARMMERLGAFDRREARYIVPVKNNLESHYQKSKCPVIII